MAGERVVTVLDPGTYWVRSRQTIVPIDVRPRPLELPYRELATADGKGIGIRMFGEYCIADPVLFLKASSDGHRAFYLALEREIASAVGELDRPDLLSSRVSPAARVRERIEPRAAQLGVVLAELEVCDLVAVQ